MCAFMPRCKNRNIMPNLLKRKCSVNNKPFGAPDAQIWVDEGNTQ